MRIFYGLDQVPRFERVAVTVGSYDGVHVGHRILLSHLKREAERIGGQSLVVTFSPHPRLALDPGCGMRLLSSLEEKCHLIKGCGVENLLVIPFDYAFSRLEPAEFVQLLVDEVGMKSLVVGYDHRFGRDKAGSRALLEELQQRWGFHVVEVAEQELNDEHLSSTAIRRLIEAGEVEHAARLLGGGYLLAGEEETDGVFKASEAHKLLPPAGRYRVLRTSDNQTFELVIHTDGGMQLHGREPLEAGQVLLRFEE